MNFRGAVFKFFLFLIIYVSDPKGYPSWCLSLQINFSQHATIFHCYKHTKKIHNVGANYYGKIVKFEADKFFLKEIQNLICEWKQRSSISK